VSGRAERLFFAMVVILGDGQRIPLYHTSNLQAEEKPLSEETSPNVQFKYKAEEKPLSEETSPIVQHIHQEKPLVGLKTF
jgi:hypothetical protein